MNLIGARVEIDGKEWLVHSYTLWSKQYVWLQRRRIPEHERWDMICRPVSVVQHKVLPVVP